MTFSTNSSNLIISSPSKPSLSPPAYPIQSFEILRNDTTSATLLEPFQDLDSDSKTDLELGFIVIRSISIDQINPTSYSLMKNRWWRLLSKVSSTLVMLNLMIGVRGEEAIKENINFVIVMECSLVLSLFSSFLDHPSLKSISKNKTIHSNSNLSLLIHSSPSACLLILLL